MNYYEILMWIQENLVTFHQNSNEQYELTYVNPLGIIHKVKCEDLISGVLAINECDLIT